MYCTYLLFKFVLIRVAGQWKLVSDTNIKFFYILDQNSKEESLYYYLILFLSFIYSLAAYILHFLQFFTCYKKNYICTQLCWVRLDL